MGKIDNNRSTIIADSAVSKTKDERSINYSLTQGKIRSTDFLIVSHFFTYVLLFGLVWFIFENVVYTHEKQSNDLFSFSGLLHNANFKGTDAVDTYFEMMNLERATILGLFLKEPVYNFDTDITASEELNEKMDSNLQEAFLSIRYFHSNLTGSSIKQETKITDAIFRPLPEPLGYHTQKELNSKDQVFQFLEMNLLQSLQFFTQILSKAVKLSENYSDERKIRDLTPVEYSYFVDANEFLINDGHTKILNRTLQVCHLLRESIENSSDSTYSISFIWIMSAGSLFLLVNFGLVINTLYRTHSQQLYILNSYVSLRTYNLEYEVGKLEKGLEYVLGNFAESEEAIQIAVGIVGGRTEKSLNSSQKSKSFNKDKDKQNKPKMLSKLKQHTTSKASFQNRGNIRVAQVLKSVGWIFLFNITMLIMLVIAMALLIAVDRYVRQSNQLRSAALRNSEGILDIHLRSSKVYEYSPFTSPLLSDPSLDKTLDFSGIDKSLSEFQSMWSGWRESLKDIFGEKHMLFDLVFGDICQQAYQAGLDLSKAKIEYDKCSKMNSGLALKGALYFALFEANVLKDFMSSATTILKSKENSAAMGHMDEELSGVWFNSKYLQMRVGHKSVFMLLFDLSSKIFKDKVDELSSSVSDLMASLRFIGIAIVVLPLCLFVGCSYRLLNRDFAVCFHTFRIISPETLLSNQFLLARFKRYFDIAQQ